MELVERYLQAIGQYLPAESRNDILAELRSELLEQMDARAEEWGRPLDEADVAALLKVHGRPQMVALRYLPQRSLIGPAMFPFYVWTLKRALPLVLLAWAVAHAATILFTGRADDVAGQIGHAVLGLVPTLLIFWATMTIVFAVLDYVCKEPAARAKLDQWDPLKLPALKVQPAKQKSFNVRVFELVVHCLWILYVLAIPAHPFLIMGPGVSVMRAEAVGFAPVWHTFYGLLLVMLGMQLVVKVLALRDGGRVLMKAVDFLANGIGIVALALLAFAGQIFVATSAGLDAQKLADVNHGVSLALRIALLFAAFGFVSEIWKYVRGRVHVRRQLAV
jgi:hypothetical protein